MTVFDRVNIVSSLKCYNTKLVYVESFLILVKLISKEKFIRKH